MKKVLGFGLLGVLLLAIAAFITLQYFIGSIVKSGVNKFGPAITQTPVELQGAAVSPLSGEGTLSGLRVGNPQGWSAGDAFRLGKVHLSMEPFSVFKDHIVINELIIEQPEFLYETRLVTSNINDLLKNIEQTVGGKAAAPQTKEGKPVKMVVKKLVLRDGKVTVSGAGLAAITVPLPPINMTDIGTAENGITPAQVAFAVMRNVTATIVGAVAQVIAQGGGAAGAAAGSTVDTVKQIGGALQGIFGGKKKTEPAPQPAPK